MTTHMQIFALYAALNGLILAVLSAMVMRARLKHQVLIGDGGVEALVLAQRAHGNAVEYIPITLILMGALAAMDGSAILLHAIGAALTVGRLLHGFALSRSAGATKGREIGIVLTFLALLVSIGACLFYAIR